MTLSSLVVALNWRSLAVRCPSSLDKKQAVGNFEMWVVLGSAGDMPHLLTLQMACETEQNPLGVFKCQLCALTAPYSYKGQQPPDSQSVV